MASLYDAVALSTLLPLLSTDLPGCSPADKLWALAWAFRDFCARSRCWRERLTLVNVPADATAVPLIPALMGAEAPLGRVERVTHLKLGGWQASRAGNWGLCPYEDGQRYLKFNAAPMPEGSEVWTLEADVIVMPLAQGAAGPDFVVQEYAEGIAAGARARLKLQTRRRYTDREGAAFAQGDFRRELARACVAAQSDAPPAATDHVVLPDPLDLGWALPEGDGEARDLSDPAELTYSEFMLAFRTLVMDLKTRGVV